MLQNIARLNRHLSPFNVSLRPHVKTAKCPEIVRLMTGSSAGPVTVSTLKEAEQFAAAGFTDILYAVGIVPSKFDRVLELRRDGVDLAIILDGTEMAEAVIKVCQESGERIPVLIEIDSDNHRAGIQADDPQLVEVARILYEGGAKLRGVMTHAGASYEHPGSDALVAMAEQERKAVADSANILHQAGFPCATVSVGSTPTSHFVQDLSGVTEVRAGVYVFNDLVMAGLGVCNIDDIAISVLCTVIGQQWDKGWILVDAGWTAMSRDRGTAVQTIDQGYGLVCDVSGRPYPDLIMINANQEHGILAVRPGSKASLPELAVGSLLRILPNHACATASQFDCYHVLGEGYEEISETWSRFSGW
jgi:D-serine deaminase-like pyridoxal phosphate-dependent protein